MSLTKRLGRHGLLMDNVRDLWGGDHAWRKWPENAQSPEWCVHCVYCDGLDGRLRYRAERHVASGSGGGVLAGGLSRPEFISAERLAGAAKLAYVALGDSYSSGEGNPPFEAGTNNAKTGDTCHRSRTIARVR